MVVWVAKMIETNPDPYKVPRAPKMSLNHMFVKGVASVENSIRKGFNIKRSRWFPHASIEGGRPTLAYGHKVTPQEEATNTVVIDGVSVAFETDGLTELQAVNLLKQDIDHHEEIARKHWNMHFQRTPYDTLEEKYRGILVDLVFNTGRLATKHEFIWKRLGLYIKAKDDHMVLKSSVPSFKDTKGDRHFLSERRKTIAISLGYNPDLIKGIRWPTRTTVPQKRGEG